MEESHRRGIPGLDWQQDLDHGWFARGAQALNGKWVYKVKRDQNGKITRFKARWVVKGYEQEYGINYDQTYARVVKNMSWRSLIAIAAQYDFEIEQMDVVTAFLYGEITEEIYVEFPIGFNKDRKVCKLLKGLYGLKQAPRLWEQKRKEAFHKLGFELLDSDYCVYNTLCGLSRITIATFVDDFLLIRPLLTKVNNLKI